MPLISEMLYFCIARQGHLFCLRIQGLSRLCGITASKLSSRSNLHLRSKLNRWVSESTSFMRTLMKSQRILRLEVSRLSLTREIDQTFNSHRCPINSAHWVRMHRWTFNLKNPHSRNPKPSLQYLDHWPSPRLSLRYLVHSHRPKLSLKYLRSPCNCMMHPNVNHWQSSRSEVNHRRQPLTLKNQPCRWSNPRKSVRQPCVRISSTQTAQRHHHMRSLVSWCA